MGGAERVSERASEGEGGESWWPGEALHNARLSAAGRAQSSALPVFDTRGPAGQGAVPDHSHDLEQEGPLFTSATPLYLRKVSGSLCVCLAPLGTRERLRERLKWPL